MSDSEQNISDEGRSGAWPWSVLGVGEAADASRIRAAYARALKRIDQQRDVAGFQALREARDEALFRAAGAVPAVRPPPETEESEAGGWPSDDAQDEPAFRALQDLLDNPWARANLASWERLLGERPLMAEPQAEAFERRIVFALDGWLDTGAPPPHEVFLLLDAAFGWSAAHSNLGAHLSRLRERRLRTIIASLRA